MSPSEGRRRLARMERKELAEMVTLAGRPWALAPESMEMLASAIRSGVVFELPSAEIERQAEVRHNQTAVIPLRGVLTPDGGGLLGLLLGLGGGVRQFQADLKSALTDNSIDRIVLNVDSPGGVVAHMPETAKLIREGNQVKPIVAVANTLAASAAYWLAAQAGELVVTPSGEVGSIGAFLTHVDRSGALEDAGLDVTLIAAGRYKTEGNQYEPLSDDGAAARQAKVDAVYDSFVRDVAEGRGVSASRVRSGYGEGRSLLAEDALEAGMVDRIDTLENVLGDQPLDDQEPDEPDQDEVDEDEDDHAEAIDYREIAAASMALGIEASEMARRLAYGNELRAKPTEKEN